MYGITCLQTKRTIREYFQETTYTNKALTNPGIRHKPQLQGDTIGVHFASTTHKGTLDFQIQVLEFISLLQNSERALKLRLQKEETIDAHLCSDAQAHMTEHHGVNTWGRTHQLKGTTLL